MGNYQCQFSEDEEDWSLEEEILERVDMTKSEPFYAFTFTQWFRHCRLVPVQIINGDRIDLCKTLEEAGITWDEVAQPFESLTVFRGLRPADGYTYDVEGE